MRAHIFLALVLGTALQGFGQAATAPAPGLTKNPHAIFASAVPFYDFNDATLKPWHLKATYQLYDDKGNPAQQGTFEYWWASPKAHRSTWTRPGESYTAWHTTDGREAYVGNEGKWDYFEIELESALLSPLPSPARLDSSTTLLERRDVKLSGQKFPCIYLIAQYLTAHDQEVSHERSISSTYCFDPKLPVLLFSYKYGGTLIASFNKITRFQGKYLANEIQIGAGGRRLLTASVDTVNEIAPSDPALIPSKDAVFTSGLKNSTGKATGKSLVKGQPPVYPLAAKQQGIQGTVLIEATIGTDGKIERQRVIYSPSPLLTGASLKAVSHWVYKPYIVNGQPMELHTLINVVYSLGP